MHIRTYRILVAGILAVWMAVMTPLATMAHTHTTDVRRSTTLTRVQEPMADAACRGETKIEEGIATPFVQDATDIYLDSCLTEAVTAAALGGGEFAELCGLFVAAAGPGFCIAVDPILVIGADIIQNVNDDDGQGVGVILRIFTPNVCPRPGPSVWPQGLSSAASHSVAP